MNAEAPLFAIVGHGIACMVDAAAVEDLPGGPYGPAVTLADIAVRLDVWHTSHCWCGMDLGLSENVWAANLRLDDAAEDEAVLEEYFPAESHRIDPNTSLTDLPTPEPPETGTVAVLFGKEPGTDVRRAQFAGVKWLRGKVFRVSYDPSPRLPPPDLTDYRALVALPGTCFVDTTQLIELWYSRNPSSLIPVIRRPPGYGKSTLLSMCCAVFGYAIHDRIIPKRSVYWPLSWHRRPVLMLDFSELDFRGCTSEDAMLAHADAFMDRAAKAFWDKYVPGEVYTPTGCYYSPHCMIKAVCNRLLPLYLAIDNYTHPFLSADMYSLSLVEHVIWHKVLAPFLTDRGDASGAIFRGIMVGTDTQGLEPFSSFSAFARLTRDLTYSAEYAAVGFTAPNVTDLARVVLRDDPERERQFLAACRLPPASNALLCPADVVRLMRAYQTGQPPAAGAAPYRFVVGECMDVVEYDGPNDYDPGV
ncbi:hypothetical protein AURDEDRAFT_170405 [Auricularia subglabra TFB-10046 SS5]|nr:hypothetical protein AURDEDRAFT_170405 [Auricularia subglabra TFB-10046 SS5]